MSIMTNHTSKLHRKESDTAPLYCKQRRRTWQPAAPTWSSRKRTSLPPSGTRVLGPVAVVVVGGMGGGREWEILRNVGVCWRLWGVVCVGLSGLCMLVRFWFGPILLRGFRCACWLVVLGSDVVNLLLVCGHDTEWHNLYVQGFGFEEGRNLVTPQHMGMYVDVGKLLFRCRIMDGMNTVTLNERSVDLIIVKIRSTVVY